MELHQNIKCWHINDGCLSAIIQLAEFDNANGLFLIKSMTKANGTRFNMSVYLVCILSGLGNGKITSKYTVSKYKAKEYTITVLSLFTEPYLR